MISTFNSRLRKGYYFLNDSRLGANYVDKGIKIDELKEEKKCNGGESMTSTEPA